MSRSVGECKCTENDAREINDSIGSTQTRDNRQSKRFMQAA